MPEPFRRQIPTAASLLRTRPPAEPSRALETYTRRNRIQSLKAELDYRRGACASIEREFERCALSRDHKADLLQHWEDTVKEMHLLETTLGLLEREERRAPVDDELAEAHQLTYFRWFYHPRS